jgi:hypothetical protein
MKGDGQTLAIAGGALVGILGLAAAIALLAWPELGVSVAERDRAPALKECMTTCTTWHLVGSLYHRGFCTACEDLPKCVGAKDKPPPACIDALRACYHREGCIANMRVACDKRCVSFIDNLTRGSSGARW